MSAANGLTPNDGARSALQRCADNVVAAFARLARPAKRPVPLWSASPRQIAITAGIMLAALLVCIMLIDGPAVRAVAKLPRWIIWPFDEITDFGQSGWFLWPLGLLFLAMAALSPRLTPISQAVLAAMMVRVGFLFLAIGVPSLFTTTTKRMIGRLRPSIDGALDPYMFKPFIWRADYAGLPSGHTTTAFAVLVAFGMLWPRARTALLLYAMLIALSRVMVLAHFPSDVLAGALVGGLGVILVSKYFASRRLLFGETLSGAPMVFPGPSVRRIKAVGRDLLSD
jgi:undecaprenyl-diphosphatase